MTMLHKKLAHKTFPQKFCFHLKHSNSCHFPTRQQQMMCQHLRQSSIIEFMSAHKTSHSRIFTLSETCYCVFNYGQDFLRCQDEFSMCTHNEQKVGTWFDTFQKEWSITLLQHYETGPQNWHICTNTNIILINSPSYKHNLYGEYYVSKIWAFCKSIVTSDSEIHEVTWNDVLHFLAT